MTPRFDSAVMSLLNQHGGVDGLLQQFEQGGLALVHEEICGSVFSIPVRVSADPDGNRHAEPRHPV
jgi:hypothetical protein